MFWVWPGMIWAGCRWRRDAGESLDRLCDWCQRSSQDSAGRAYGSGANALAACGDGTCTALHPRCGMAARCRTAKEDTCSAGNRRCRTAGGNRARPQGDGQTDPVCFARRGRAWAGRCCRAVRDSGAHAAKSLVAVSCAALQNLVDWAELFGYQGGIHRRLAVRGLQGAFVRALGGTRSLDEIGDMPLPLQGGVAACTAESVRWFPWAAGGLSRWILRWCQPRRICHWR